MINNLTFYLGEDDENKVHFGGKTIPFTILNIKF